MKNVAITTRGPVEYRLEGQSPKTLLVLGGGHTNCDTGLVHDSFLLEQDYQLLIPSRPGYGQTPSSTGRKAEEFAEALVLVLDELGIAKVTVLAISAAGRTALQLAGLYAQRVERLILECTVTHHNWPKKREKLLSPLVFNRWSEKRVWAMLRQGAKRTPRLFLKIMLPNLTTREPGKVLKELSPLEQQQIVAYLSQCRSQAGFLNDIKHDCGNLSRISAPTLIIHSPYDGGAPFDHAKYAAEHIAGAELYELPAAHHLIWLTPYASQVEAKLKSFLN